MQNVLCEGTVVPPKVAHPACGHAGGMALHCTCAGLLAGGRWIECGENLTTAKNCHIRSNARDRRGASSS